MYEIIQRETVRTADEEAEIAIRKLQVREIMKTIPGYVQRIAGKSLPFEVSHAVDVQICESLLSTLPSQKYVARKSKKFLAQNDSLRLPGLELAYMLSCLSLTTRQAILQVHLPAVDESLSALEHVRERVGESLPTGWWDGMCITPATKWACCAEALCRLLPQSFLAGCPAALPLSPGPTSEAAGI